jgi:general secretion pathway protein J
MAWRTESGFTLLEVLIATTLLGVMMMLLTGSLRISAESWDAGEQRMAKASRMFVVENFLRSHIGGLLPLPGLVRNDEIEPALAGTKDSLSYIAPLPEQINAGGLYRFKLYVAERPEGKDLRVRIVPYVNNPQKIPEQQEPLDDLALLENVARFQLSYLPEKIQAEGQASNPAPPLDRSLDWLEQWGGEQLPALIRVQIEAEGEDPWPTLIIAPRARSLR